MFNVYFSSLIEAEYAFQQGRAIIPLKMEKEYKADGWLGLLIGAKLFFDFSGKYPFEEKIKGLFKELDSTIPSTGKNVSRLSIFL